MTPEKEKQYREEFEATNWEMETDFIDVYLAACKKREEEIELCAEINLKLNTAKSEIVQLKIDKDSLQKQLEETEKELYQQRFNNKHNLSIDQKERVKNLGFNNDYVEEVEDRNWGLGQKLAVAVEVLESISESLRWYCEQFKGPEHEFWHFWRVELPHEVREALEQIDECGDYGKAKEAPRQIKPETMKES